MSETRRVCGQCGAALDPADMFCRACGKPITAMPPGAAPAVPTGTGPDAPAIATVTPAAAQRPGSQKKSLRLTRGDGFAIGGIVLAAVVVIAVAVVALGPGSSPKGPSAAKTNKTYLPVVEPKATPKHPVVGMATPRPSAVLPEDFFAAMATPMPTPMPHPRWTEFKSHTGNWMLTSMGTPMLDFQTAVQEGDYADASVLGDRVVERAAQELTWLDSHRPLACYKNVWTYYRKMMTEVKAGYIAFGEYISSGADRDRQEALSQLRQSDATRVKMQYYFDRTRCIP